MKIVIAPDKFKDSLSAIEVCENLMKGLTKIDSNINFILCPMADGGEGSLKTLNYHLDLKPVELIVNDPLFRPVNSTYFISNSTAYIEMSSASGLVLLKESERNPMLTSSFGTGELIKDAINKGLKKINLFIGGSATNDGAIGIASALGFRFYDSFGNFLSPVGGNLNKIDNIDSSKVINNIKDVDIKVFCDVDSTMFGEDGAAFTFAPQKGANFSQVKYLDKGLKNLVSKLSKNDYKNIADIPGSGAAGGVGGGAIAFLDAKLVSGIDKIIEVVQLEKQINNCDLIITGEGKLDSQTEKGKVISGICRLAKKYKKPVIVVCGYEEKNISKKLGITKVYSIQDRSNTFKDSINNAGEYLIQIGSEIFSYINKKP
tara:strand:+ start:2917 stop:4038 length:1122 start_codon:yes stop_codon:yes gene_type:complete